ncbi:hypothetical protein SVIOM74S_04970 [Streptomyces violarus]
MEAFRQAHCPSTGSWSNVTGRRARHPAYGNLTHRVGTSSKRRPGADPVPLGETAEGLWAHDLMFILGIGLFVVGLLFSIAWHELGHLSTAKLFGIRVPHTVGFGPTIWSRKKGDEPSTGSRPIPFGRYIRMIGMFPPGPDGRLEVRSTAGRTTRTPASGRVRELGRATRTGRLTRARPEARDREVAGPFMVLAVALFLSILMGFS